jgi:hypothetical protein
MNRIRRNANRHLRAAVAGVALLLAQRAGAATLGDLGFSGGIALAGPGASAEVFFPMPAGATAANLVLDLAASPALDRYSSLTVFAGGTPIATIPSTDAARQVTVPIPPSLARGGYLPIRLAADQALRRGDPCFDNNVASVWTRIGADSHLDVTAPLERGVGRYWAALGGQVAIGLPATPTPADLETATILATALTARGAAPVMAAPGAPAAIVIAPATDGATLRVDGTPAALRVANPAAARALVGAPRLMAATPAATASGEALPAASPSAPDSVSFTEMGIEPATLSVLGATTFHFTLPFSRLPADTHPTALTLFGAGSVVPPGQTLIATVSAGKQLVWSQAFRGAVALDGASIPIPATALHNNMPVTVELVRGGTPGGCGGVDTLSFQLRGTSRVTLARGYAALRDLPGFAVPFGKPALVRIDPASMPMAGAAIPLLARLLVDAGASPAAVTIATGNVALDTPFIDLGAKADAAFADSAPARPDLSRVVIARPADGVRVELDGAQALTVVQTVTTTGGIPGLWISPGDAASFANPQPLSTGNVAVLGAARDPVLFDTLSPVVVVEQQQVTNLNELLAKWRIEIFVALWAVVTLLIVAIAVRLRRPSRKA